MHPIRQFLALVAFVASTSPLPAVNLIVPLSVSVSGITVTASTQVKTSPTESLQIQKVFSKPGWELTGNVVGGQIVHSGSGFAIPAAVQFTAITCTDGGDGTTNGITFSPDGTTIT
jgi:hypothetical protein